MQANGAGSLGRAHDRGWWVLVTAHADHAGVFAAVPMSHPDPGRLTAAEAVAAAGPWTRLAQAWRGLTLSTSDGNDTGAMPRKRVDRSVHDGR
jgi:hypothetical protein